MKIRITYRDSQGVGSVSGLMFASRSEPRSPKPGGRQRSAPEPFHFCAEAKSREDACH